MKTLAFDTSTTQTGWAYYEKDKYIDSGYINFKGIKDVNERMAAMVQKIRELIKNKRPDYIVAEKTSVARNQHTQRVLTMILGALFGFSVENGISFHMYSPGEWRKVIDGGSKPRKREELKKWDIEKAHEILRLNNLNDDEADAVLIGYAFCKERLKGE